MSKILMLALLAVPLAACDDQVDSDHQGTALARLTGTVRNARVQPSGSVEVVAVWANTFSEPDVVGVDAVQVTGSFPTHFALSIYTPPAPELLNDDDTGVKFAVATLRARNAGTSDEDYRNLLGAETEHMLVYVPADVPAGSNASLLLRSTPKAGFHIYGVGRPGLVELTRRDDCQNRIWAEQGEEPTFQQIFNECGGFVEFDDFVPLESDLTTPLEIELVDDPDSINLPNWT